MKKTIALALSIVLVLASLSCTALAEEAPKFVTIQEWMDAKGECGNCMLLLKITQILNPVLAVAADDTGTINLFSGTGDIPLTAPRSVFLHRNTSILSMVTLFYFETRTSPVPFRISSTFPATCLSTSSPYSFP